MPDRPLRQPGLRSCGFSLLELMITLAIGSVLLGLALPSFRTLMGDSQISSTVNDLVFALQTARSEAIKRAGFVALCTSATPLAADTACDGKGYADGWIVYVDADADGSRGTDEELILQSGPRSAAFAFAPVSRFAAGVRFSDTGASTTASGTPIAGHIDIEYAGGEDSRTVIVGANGRIASESP